VAALRLSDTDRIRREKLVGMLGSRFDGERLNALAMLQRMADSYKTPIHELLLDANSDQQRVELAERRAREAELRAQRAERAQAPTPAEPDAPKLPTGWRGRFTEARELNLSLRFLTAWEAEFVTDLIERGVRWPSPKQTVVIVRILEKASAFGASSAAADWEDVP
jgi:hypothetical protein